VAAGERLAREREVRAELAVELVEEEARADVGRVPDLRLGHRPERAVRDDPERRLRGEPDAAAHCAPRSAMRAVHGGVRGDGLVTPSMKAMYGFGKDARKRSSSNLAAVSARACASGRTHSFLKNSSACGRVFSFSASFTTAAYSQLRPTERDEGRTPDVAAGAEAAALACADNHLAHG
jgi:hypothetical protein